MMSCAKARSVLAVTLAAVLMVLACTMLFTERSYADPTPATWVTEENSAGQITSVKLDMSSMAVFDEYLVNIYKDDKMISQKTVTTSVYDVSDIVLASDSGVFRADGYAYMTDGSSLFTDFASSADLAFYTITIDKQGHGNSFKINHIKDGTSVKTSVKNAYISTFDTGGDDLLMRYFENGDAFMGVALHSLSTYSDIDALKGEACYLLPGGAGKNYTLGGNVTLYDIWFKVINNVELTVEAPVCGTSTTTSQSSGDWNWNSQTNTPTVTIPAGEGYHYTSTASEPGSWWIQSIENDDQPYIGDFEGENAYTFQSCLSSDFGYVFPTDNDAIALTVTVNGQAIPRTDAYNGAMPYSYSVIGDGTVPLTIDGTVTAAHAVVVDPEVPATCTSDGLTEGSHCGACYAVLQAQSTIPGGHKWSTDYVVDAEPTCTTAGSKHLVCTVCGAEKDPVTIPALGHKWSTDYVVDAEPTCTANGIKHQVCTVCSAKTDPETIPALGHNEVANPGQPATLTADGMTGGTRCDRCGQDLAAPTPISHPASFSLAATSYVYNGSARKPAVTVKDAEGKVIAAANYKVSYANNIKAGNATATVVFNGASYQGTKTLSFKIDKAANPLTIKAKTATVKYAKVKKKAQTLAVTKVIAFTKKGQGTVTYAKVSGNKKITINKTTGKVTVKKGLKKGTYKVKVKAMAAGNANYKASAWKTTTFTVRVK